jgi:riboflavin biosynthesis pyrimidine reductase
LLPGLGGCPGFGESGQGLRQWALVQDAEALGGAGEGDVEFGRAHGPSATIRSGSTTRTASNSRPFVSDGATAPGTPGGPVADGVQAAVAQAMAAAGERAVTVIGGADLTRQLLAADLVDELRVDVMPVLLGAGLRLFERTGPLVLEKLGVDEVGARTSLRFRVATAPR